MEKLSAAWPTKSGRIEALRLRGVWVGTRHAVSLHGTARRPRIYDGRLSRPYEFDAVGLAVPAETPVRAMAQTGLSDFRGKATVRHAMPWLAAEEVK